MNQKIFKTLLCLGLLTSVFSTVNYAQDSTVERYIQGVDNDENTGADSYGNAGDNRESRFYKNPDYFNLKNDDTLVIIEKFRTMQQTTEWSCGNVTALMVLENMGIKNKFTEMAIAETMKSSTDLDTPNAKPGTADNFGEFGTDVEQMFEFFSAVKGVKVYETNYKANPKPEDLYSNKDLVPEADFGNIKRVFNNVSLYASENDPNTDKWVTDAKDSYFVKWLTGHLKEGRPIMVEWADWNGHWQAIIGYDNNGTPTIGDDTLIFADPYDTSDHSQDGYYVYPLERWFYMWHDRSIAKKPLQLQPYIVVGEDK